MVLTQHVSECQQCDAKLGAIEEQSDDLVRALAMLPATADDEETFQSLQASLLANPERFGEGNDRPTDLFLAEIPANVALPVRLGNYELLEQIGAGANGAVFRARHRRLEKQVAVKLLINAAGSAVEEFLNEMRVIGKLDHPNIIQATDAGEHEGTYFLVMEFAPGLDVSSLLRKTGPLGVANACEIARQTALGLSVAHANELVHRDVKTSNLLFTASGQIKLLDLGLATISSRSHSDDTLESGPRGTADYMAPEQWREASRVDAKADIYSLGCTLFKLLTGAPPFRPLPSAVSSLEEAHINGAIPSAAETAKSLPSGLDALIGKMLAKDPAHRPRSATEIASQLSKYSVGANLPQLAQEVIPEAARLANVATHNGPTYSPMTRRVMLSTSLAALTGIAWGTHRWRNRTIPINTGKWRRITPVAPKLIRLSAQPIDSGPPDESLTEIDHVATVTSNDPMLLHLGRPMTELFRFRATLNRSDWSNGAGLFFRLRATQPDQYEFQTFESLYSEAQWWLYWNSYQVDQPNEPTTLAEATLAAPAANAIELSVTLGSSGFPDFAVSGQRVAKSAWTLSTEARNLVTAHSKQIATAYTGRIGIFHNQGTTSIRDSALMYVN